jgi:hypothetical protein
MLQKSDSFQEYSQITLLPCYVDPMSAPHGSALGLQKEEMTSIWPGPPRELYRSSNCRLPTKLVQTFADRRCHVASVTDHHGRILGFLDRS